MKSGLHLQFLVLRGWCSHGTELSSSLGWAGTAPVGPADFKHNQMWQTELFKSELLNSLCAPCRARGSQGSP